MFICYGGNVMWGFVVPVHATCVALLAALLKVQQCVLCPCPKVVSLISVSSALFFVTVLIISYVG